MSLLMNMMAIEGGSTPSINKEDYICIMMKGQSNVMGRVLASTLPAEDQAIQTDIFTYNFLNSQIEPYQAGVNSTLDQPSAGYYGYELYLAQLLRDYHNKKVVIFKYGEGGTSLSQNVNAKPDWNVNSVDELQDNWVNYYNDFLIKCSQARINPITKINIWHQGESDSLDETVSLAYETEESALFTEDFTVLAEGTKIINMLIKSNSGAFASNVRTGKANNTTSFADVESIDTESYGLLPDNLHLNDAGLQSASTDIYNLSKDYWV